MCRRGCLLIALVVFSGCRGGSAPIASPDVARKALQTSLDAWRSGKPPSSLSGEKPRIEVVDFEWKAGKVLLEFEIGEGGPGEGTLTFPATLTLKGEKAPRRVRYMVLGLDPVLVFRDQDFDRFINMDNAPTTRPKSRR